jgi:4-amino-4-deoxy-L-arabinose transferase-like glycosyltransferase
MRIAPLAVVLVVAAVLRVWAIDFCLPSPYCRPDEEAVGAIALKVFAREFNPHWFDWPSLFLYLTALALVPVFKVGQFLGWYRGEYHFLQAISSDPSPVFLSARLLSAGAGVLSVWLVYRTARRWFPREDSLIAAAFLAGAFLHVRDSHFGVTDVTATCLALASFAGTVRYASHPATRTLLPAALLAGFAASTKYNAGLILLPQLVAIALSRPAGAIRLVLRDSGVAALSALAGFLVATPYAVLDHATFVSALHGIGAHLSGGHGADVGLGWRVHLTSSLRYGLGLPLLLAGIAGLVHLLVRRPREGLLLASFPLAYYVVIGSGRTTFARYILPVVPFLCISAAYFLGVVSRWAAARASRPAWGPALTVALAVVVIAPSAWSTWQFLDRLAKDDSRVLAARWIADRFPDGASIGQAGRVSTYLYFPPQMDDRPARYDTTTVDSDDDRPDVIVVPTSALERSPERSPALREVLSHYTRAERVPAYDPAASDRLVYDWQDEFYLPLAGFSSVIRPGPTLDIYVRR